MKARLAKKLHKGLSVISLKSGDVLAVRLPEYTSVEDGQMAVSVLRPLFPNNKVIAIPNDFEVLVIREALDE